MQTLDKLSYSKQRRPATSIGLITGIPSPFPREEFLRTQCTSSEAFIQQEEPQAGPSQTVESAGDDVIASSSQRDLSPSIAYVQKSCIMTLNNIFSRRLHWSPISPERRHSMPSVPKILQNDIESSSSALQALVTNLRNWVANGETIQTKVASTNTDLINELRMCVEKISSSLEPEDASLGSSLVSLLSYFDRLSNLPSTSSHFNSPYQDSTWESAGSPDMFSVLRQRLADLQQERLSLQPEALDSEASPVLVVEATLLWHRIDEELENVVAMCKERADSIYRLSHEQLPPQYDFEDYAELPPNYDDSGERASVDSSKSRPTLLQSARPSDEKMRLDLENITTAIDRLYLVAPQLHNQRVELKSTKLAQLEKASRGGRSRVNGRGKQKESNIRELENIVELLAKASDRSLHGQSVILEGGLQGILAKARKRDDAKREAFVEQLASHSSSGRLHSQDAVLSTKPRDPDALLTLPEFIREPLPLGSRARLLDPDALLTLPEFVRERAYLEELDPESKEEDKPKKKNRLRSASAPALSWLLSTSRSGSMTPLSPRSRSRLVPSSPPVPNVSFRINYVAENHENLHHVFIFCNVIGALPGIDLEAEVQPLPQGKTGEGNDRLVISSGPRTSLPLVLPARVQSGKHVVRVQGDYCEVKMATVASTHALSTATEDHPPLLDAAQLSSANPTSFICASCSLPLVQSTKIQEYRDLPSEHWTELVEAWMCHSDQKLHDQVVKQGKIGFWPKAGQALVGGSYILFEESCVTSNNLRLVQENKREDWQLARCLCGAVIGRYQHHPACNSPKPLVFRFLKYAIQPVSRTTHLLKIPLSAFIVEDMTELVRAHATYRFVILDEEEENPRILIWLFKPSIRLAYATSAAHSMPKSGCIHAAKVLYKVLDLVEQAGDLKTPLQRYPGFPQAEYLFYPMPICRRLANLLKESTAAYPEGLREMTGLRVGWLHRA